MPTIPFHPMYFSQPWSPWKGVEPELIYTALPRAHWVSPNATLNTCENNEDQTYCKPTEASLRIKLVWTGDKGTKGKTNATKVEDIDLDDEDASNSDTDLNSVCDFDSLSTRAHAQSCGKHQ